MALVGDSYEYYDKKFYDLTVPIAEVEELFSGCRWAEGPVWFNDGGFLVWSDIPNNRLLRWMPDRRRRRLPRQLEFRQRQHARPPGPARLLRAWRQAGDRAPSPTAPSPPSPTNMTASGSIRPTMSSSNRTARSGSPIRATASCPTMRAIKATMEQKGCYVFRVDPATAS